MTTLFTFIFKNQNKCQKFFGQAKLFKMGKTTRGFAFKTKTTFVKKGRKKSKWKRKNIAEKREIKHQKEEEKSALMFKIAKENGSYLAAEGKSDMKKVR